MRLALQFKLIFVFVFCSFSAFAVISDRYLFRIGDVVVGANDLEQSYSDLDALGCYLSDSLLLEYLSAGYLPKLKKSLPTLSDPKVSIAQENSSVIFLSSVRQLWKLLIYVDGQEVNLTSSLEKTFLAPSKCPSVKFEKKLRDSFRRWLRLEVYLRSRYAPNGFGDKQDRRAKKIQSITQFAESIDKQLIHENFW
ncbi:MAG: hypothetical protein K2P81_10640 [Bacteriovoracaceae bacterium]|nr:hypothetical protein [Bacteriovoracaceae bacterium]